MAVPKVDKKMLEELETMGFAKAKATRALHFSGNTNVEDAINWIVEHENDPDIDEIPLVDVDIEIDSSQSFPITEEVKVKAQKLRKNGSPHSFPITEESPIKAQKLSREQLHMMKEGTEKKLEIEREKERIQASKKLNEMKRIAEENERQRQIALRKAEKEEEKRAREKVIQKLEQDKEQGPVLSYTEILLVPLTTPDFSMPYNVITITCTVFALYFGSLLNVLRRRIGEEERRLKDKGAKKTGFLPQALARLSAKLRGKSSETSQPLSESSSFFSPKLIVKVIIIAGIAVAWQYFSQW